MVIDMNMSREIVPNDVLSIIQMLNSQFKDRRDYKNDNRNNRKRHVVSSEPFNTTVLIKFEGIDKYIGDIRTKFNKLTDKTYDKISIEIINIIDTIIENNVEDDINKVVESIFNVVKNNKFYSHIYAKIYKELINKYAIFKDKLFIGLEQYEEISTNIVFVSSNENYEEFCKYNYANDMRKSFTTFILNLMKQEIIDINSMEEYLCILTKKIDDIISHEGNKEVVQELVENIAIYLSNSKQEMMDSNKFEHWKQYVTEMSSKKITDYKSYSSRCKFKYMDILDTWGKK